MSAADDLRRASQAAQRLTEALEGANAALANRFNRAVEESSRTLKKEKGLREKASEALDEFGERFGISDTAKGLATAAGGVGSTVGAGAQLGIGTAGGQAAILEAGLAKIQQGILEGLSGQKGAVGFAAGAAAVAGGVPETLAEKQIELSARRQGIEGALSAGAGFIAAGVPVNLKGIAEQQTAVAQRIGEARRSLEQEVGIDDLGSEIADIGKDIISNAPQAFAENLAAVTPGLGEMKEAVNQATEEIRSLADAIRGLL